MPRLRNTTTGVVVNVDEDLAGRLEGYEPVKAAPAEKAAPKKSVK